MNVKSCILCPLGTQIYILNGTDPEGQPVRYGLTFEPGSKEYFKVDHISGNISLIKELDREVSQTVNKNVHQQQFYSVLYFDSFFLFILCPVCRENKIQFN